MKPGITMLSAMQLWKIALLCFDLGAGLYLGGKVTADVRPPAAAATPLPLTASAPDGPAQDDRQQRSALATLTARGDGAPSGAPARSPCR